MARDLLIMTALLLLAGPVCAQDGAGEDHEATQRVRRAAEQSLGQRFPESADRLKVRVKRVSGDAETLPEPRIAWPAASRMPNGNTQVKVLRANGDKAGWALLYVAHFDSVLVVAQTLPAEARITDEQLETAWIETTRFRGTPLRKADWQRMQSRGDVLADHRLRAGRALHQRDVRSPYAAKMGDKVQMLYARKGFAMRLDCKARESGHRGDVVRVYSTTTHSTYRARLLAGGRAKWIETL